MIPLVHDFAGETILVFGGGPVGARKARRFVQEADVIVISPTFDDESFGGASRVRGAPDSDGVAMWLNRIEPALVVAATDHQNINGAIAEAARSRGILVNRADVAGSRPTGSVIVPATVRDGPLLISISTEGTSPALSRGLRVRLQGLITGSERVAEAIEFVAEVVQRREFGDDIEREVLRAVASDSDVWTAARDDAGNTKTVAMRVANTVLEQ